MGYFQVKIPENGRKNIFRDKQPTNKVKLIFFDVKVLTERQHMRFWTVMQLQVKRQKNSANNISTSKKTRKKRPPKLFRGFEGRKKVQLMFSRPKNNMKGKCYSFSDYKQRNKVCLVFLKWKMQQDSYCWYISRLKSKKMVERTYLETSKEEKKIPLMFLDVNVVRGS